MTFHAASCANIRNMFFVDLQNTKFFDRFSTSDNRSFWSFVSSNIAVVSALSDAFRSVVRSYIKWSDLAVCCHSSHRAECFMTFTGIFCCTDSCLTPVYSRENATIASEIGCFHHEIRITSVNRYLTRFHPQIDRFYKSGSAKWVNYRLSVFEVYKPVLTWIKLPT